MTEIPDDFYVKDETKQRIPVKSIVGLDSNFVSKLQQRLIEKTEKTEGCWNWIGYLTSLGYGVFVEDYRIFLVHRVSYELAKGMIPDGFEIDHLCRNTKCVNPSHLEAVTPRINKLRGTSPSAINALKTVCPKGHPYTSDNLAKSELKKGQRVCLTCKRIRELEIYQKNLQNPDWAEKERERQRIKAQNNRNQARTIKFEEMSFCKHGRFYGLCWECPP